MNFPSMSKSSMTQYLSAHPKIFIAFDPPALYHTLLLCRIIAARCSLAYIQRQHRRWWTYLLLQYYYCCCMERRNQSRKGALPWKKCGTRHTSIKCAKQDGKSKSGFLPSKRLTLNLLNIFAKNWRNCNALITDNLQKYNIRSFMASIKKGLHR